MWKWQNWAPGWRVQSPCSRQSLGLAAPQAAGHLALTTAGEGRIRSWLARLCEEELSSQLGGDIQGGPADPTENRRHVPQGDESGAGWARALCFVPWGLHRATRRTMDGLLYAVLSICWTGTSNWVCTVPAGTGAGRA